MMTFSTFTASVTLISGVEQCEYFRNTVACSLVAKTLRYSFAFRLGEWRDSEGLGTAPWVLSFFAVVASLVCYVFWSITFEAKQAETSSRGPANCPKYVLSKRKHRSVYLSWQRPKDSLSMIQKYPGRRLRISLRREVAYPSYFSSWVGAEQCLYLQANIQPFKAAYFTMPRKDRTLQPHRSPLSIFRFLEYQ